MDNEECRNCWETHPCPRPSPCCVRGSRSKKEKGERFMTNDPLRCITCQAFIAESSTDPLSQLTSPSQDKSSLQPHCIEQQSSHAALPSSSLQGPNSGANTITMKVSESATQADTLREAVASILTHPSPKPLVEEQNSTPRGDGSSPRKRPRSHIPATEEDSATPAPAKKQRQNATLNDISSLLL
ncbi:hypothetical protein Pcinc_008995 [Petrolisthes cinctipes]|uniref:Uncharacterized protein n=1 Tax=Petrolisthes cinctipes TaxID=88211 RepID=A0AAE1KWZ3_PETCI|nr:hypothetical protein Pcinc_008995 [Petrolisthes cinctipes]